MNEGHQVDDILIEFHGVSKRFGKTQALDNVSLKIRKNTIHSIVGENGSGKTTLMSILFGLIAPDSGSISIFGDQQIISTPNVANDLGIAMAHQHFMLVDRYTNLQNIMLGHEFVRKYGYLDNEVAAHKTEIIQRKFNLHFDLNQLSGNETVANRQKVEIVKMLFTDSDILIFDEPTAVLTDEEIDGFLRTLESFRAEGKTIILISHKLNEIKRVSDDITIIRLGVTQGTYANHELSIDDIARIMVGEETTLPRNSHNTPRGALAIKLEGVYYNRNNRQLRNLNFEVYEGEITAIAGVSGNGQEELELLLGGIDAPDKGAIYLYEKNITRTDAYSRRDLGVAFIPGDIHRYALVMQNNLHKNTILRSLWDKKFMSPRMGFFKWDNIMQLTREIITEFDVRGAGEGASIAKQLSGGNQQKFVIGREIKSDHKVLVISQPTRGLDLGAISRIHNYILEEKAKGRAIVLISYILDEVLALADKVVIFNKGEVVLNKPIEQITRPEIGLYIAGVRRSNG